MKASSEAKSKIQNPKPETSPKPELGRRTVFGFEIPTFFPNLDFGFLVSPSARRLISLLAACSLVLTPLRAAEAWQEALAAMPLARKADFLDKSNAGPLLLDSFQSNVVVKALILMPGCTDEIYFFERAKAGLTNASPTLLDAVAALTNQTAIRARFDPPFLLLHTSFDPLTPAETVLDKAAFAKLRAARFTPHLNSFDRDWDYLLPLLEKSLKAQFWPERRSFNSWHFYRHSLAAHGLDGVEAVRAVSLAGKTIYTVKGRTLFGRPVLEFKPDKRPGTGP
jgi:hypothetical protein